MGARPRRLFVDALPDTGGRIALPTESVKHARVLRLQVAAQVCLFDAHGREADARVMECDRQGVVCQAEPSHEVAPDPRCLSLVLGMPKPARLDDVVRMATELGVHALRFAVCERSATQRPLSDDRMARLARVARSACAQSGQSSAPELHRVPSLVEAAQAAPPGATRLVFWEQSRVDIDDVIISTSAPIWAVVGPEGGLSQTEVEALDACGYAQVGLGSAVLRVDTAVAVIAALLLDRLGRLRE